MPEVIINGPEGRIEGRYHHARGGTAPMALVLHPHPLHGGTMNNKLVYTLYQCFVRRGFSTLRFNFRGVGRSQGSFDRGEGELAETVAAHVDAYIEAHARVGERAAPATAGRGR